MTNPITNEEALRSLPLKKLASLVIRHEYEENWDYDYDENPFFWGYRTIFVTSDGQRFDEYDYEDALEHECWWLQQEASICSEENVEE